MSEFSDESMLASIAVIGMSCRFPMASNADEYWKNIAAGVESITDLGDDELAPELVSDPNYVKRSGQLQDVELFDRDFFEMSAREASITSPAQRLLLLCAYEALEDAAYVPRHYPGAIGVYVGANKCDEWQKRIYDLTGREMREFAKRLQFSIGNDLDYCATRISYKLNLTGPSFAINTACSTSLVAISQACKGLLAYDCDMALAGGSCVTLPLKSGYWYEAGGLLSRDGCCRPFDARADGTVPGNGAGIVLLKRLLEAVEDGDHIYAIVRGTAVNNDGAAKVGYTAPSVKGQSRVISSALAFSEVNPETISYVEAHGMGTPLGDPMELESLSKAYGTITDKKRYCAIGAVKSNIGHLGAAAGVAGFIKAVMALKNQQIPPSLHYHDHNPEVDFDNSPFYVATQLQPWIKGSVPRRAAVNSFGVGGTNAHVILEEAPVRHSASFPRQTHLLLLSAKSEQALVKMIDNLADALESTPQRELADVSYTLQVGRDTYPYRYSLVCSTLQEAIAELRNSEHEIECTRVKPEGITLSYLFPGEGTQHVDMALNLYRHETVFRDTLDECAKIINPLLQRDLREILYPKSADKEWAETVLKQTRIALPALFMVEYSLARLWQSWGVRPNNMLGHCVGEYVAACISGVFELSIGLQLAVVRGSLQELNDDTENKLESIFQQANLSAPTIPFISNLTGGWISDEQAKDPSYWYKQLSANMPINQGLCSLLEDESLLLLEVGPGQTLVNGLAKIHSEKISKTLASCSDVKHHGSDQAYLMQTLGQLWMSGVVPDWEQFYACQQRYRVALPLYPFQGKRYWLDTATVTAEEGLSQQTSSPSDDRFSHLDREVTPSVDNRNLFSNLTIVPAEKRISMLKGFVQKIVKNLFGSDEISEQIPFIEMGMSSLMAIELRTQVCNALDIDTISVLMILAEDTNINRLVQLLNEELTTTEHNGADLCLTLPEMENKNNRIQSSVVPDPDNQYQPFPLTDIQQAYWLGRQGIFEGGNVATYVYIEKDIQDLDIVRFEQALNALIKRHHMLRMVVENDGQQRFLEYVPEYKIAFQDLTQYDKKAEQQALDKVRQAMSHQVFATDRWPLFEFRISQYEGEHYRLHCGFDFLIVDGSSLQIFFRDLFLIYAGEEKRLSPLEINFRECLNATQVNPESALYKKSEAYWMARVNSLPPAPALPRAREIWQIPEPKFVRREFSLDAQTWERLKKSARQHGITDSVMIANAFSEVLAQWSQSPHFTLNLTIFNRPPLHPQIYDVIGDFTSSILLEVDMSKGQNFVEKSRYIQQQLLSDLEHRSFNGIQMLRAMNSHLGSHQAVIMPVVLTSAVGVAPYLDNLLADLDEKKMRYYQQMMDTGYMISQSSQVWLDHVVWEKQGRLHFNWDTLEELFPQGVLDDMFSAYRQRLLQLAEEGDKAWQGSTDIGLPEAQARQRENINQTTVPPCNVLLHEKFDLQARRYPYQMAVINGTVELRYGDLCRLATNLAQRLRDAEIKPGQLVAVVMTKGWQQIVAVLGILYAGGAYMPIDASLPMSRIQRLLELGEVTLALTQKTGYESLEWPPTIRPVVVDMDADGEEDIGDHDGDFEAVSQVVQTDTDLAYVIFTSGSTGTPKGVMIDHRGAVNTLHHINQMFDVGRGDAILGVSSLSFDLSVYDIFGILGAGATLVLPEFEKQFDPLYWRELIDAHGITLWNSAPQLMSMLVDSFDKDEAPLRPLRRVLLSGDWIPLELPQSIKRCFSSAKVVSLGGATEASVWSIYYPIESIEADWHSIPYGKPLPNQSIMVLDHQLRPCPNYVDGHIYIGGMGVAMGYWANVEETEARFILHPQTGERMYHTGDIGHYAADGNVIFLGRSDNQVKIQGHRIELGEIEFALRHCEGVQEAVVLMVDDEKTPKRLMAYVVPTIKADTTAESNRIFLPNVAPRHLIDNLLESLSIGLQASLNANFPLIYLHIKDGRFEELAGGFYLYDSMTNLLVNIAEIDNDFLKNLHIEKYQSIHSQSAFSLFLIANKNSDDKSADEEAASIAEELVDTLIDKAVNQNMALYPVPEFNRKLVKETVNHSGDMSVLFCLEGGILMDEPIQNPLINFKTSDLSTDLLNTLKSQLPHYMVPAGIVFLPSLPLTVNGKVDSKALSKIDHMPEELANEIVAPRNEIERKVFDIWKKILRIDNFSIHDNLFELGGSSITATKIVSQAGRKLGASIPLQEFIARPSVAGMSECMAALNQRESFAAAW